jgi:predicted DCC family thiol-disulfide oxidoreductase YuxK
MRPTAQFTTPNAAVLPLTLYYDHSCHLCRSEMENLKSRDIYNQLRLIDCSPADFDTSALPFDRHTLMNCIHAMDAQGRWLKATDVFVVCYRAAQLGAIAQGFSIAKPVMERLYPFIVKHRYTLSKFHVHSLFNLITHLPMSRRAKAAFAASQACKDGVCEISPAAKAPATPAN